jgi:hypothetical protein
MRIQWLTESSALLIMALMLAPLARVQHMVFAISAIYLVTASWFSRTKVSPSINPALIILRGSRLRIQPDDFGQGADYHVALACHVHTIARLIILALVLDARVDQPQKATAITSAAT